MKRIIILTNQFASGKTWSAFLRKCGIKKPRTSFPPALLYCVWLMAPAFLSLPVFAQEGVTYDLKKPEKYEGRELGYEKTEKTKFKLPRHFIQNTITHYNFYFNANNKLTEVLNRARAQNHDDYNKLLPFYDYSLETTSKDKRNLDSIIEKTTAGILVHDLRNDWVDNLYMLMGKAYFFKKDFDTAYLTFQFINYAFSPKEEGGYDKPIGSNANREEGGSAMIVSTDEKRNIVKKVFTLPPSRNESFIWQIRTFIESDQMTRAAALIDILKHDPKFPDRLHADLEEMQALWFYRQTMYDSAAVHLEKALPNADGKLELARWEYLIAQLYERSGKPTLAKAFYERVIQHTYDPVMDVYARLNAIRQNRGDAAGEDYIQKNIDALRKMARKEIYEPYRDVIFFTAAQMEMERKNIPGAVHFLIRTTQNAVPSSPQRNMAFLLLGDIAMDQKQYKFAKNYFDSVNVSDPTIADSIRLLQDRKKALSKIVEQIRIIERQDSLQRLAFMTAADRNAYIRKLLKTLHKKQGESEEDQENNESNPSFQSNNGNAASDLFGSSTGDWYFNNTSTKAKGFSEFKSKWGNRPNVDNWEVASMVARQQPAAGEPKKGNAVDEESKSVTAAPANISYASLLANIPLTPEKMSKSKDSVERAYFALGKSFQDGLPDYQSAIDSYDTLLEKFSQTKFYEETLFNLYYCYKKLGDDANANRVLQLLQQKNPSGKYLSLILNPYQVDPQKQEQAEATKQYEHIYSDFIEGNFEQALNEKKKADSLYGDKYWTPQLLYIEAVYFVHRREDSVAKAKLLSLQKKYAGTPIAEKAKALYDALMERKRLEEYLTNLKIQRAADTTAAAGLAMNRPSNNVPATATEKKKDSATADSSLRSKPKTAADTARLLRRPPALVSAFAYTPDKPHSVVIFLNKVDPVYVTETRNAFNRYNRETYYDKTFDIVNVSLNDTMKLVVINGFDSAAAALDYMEKVQKIAGREIVPWLPASKYVFLIISAQNLDILQNNKDMAGYKKFLSAYFPGKF